ncbi:hypothetical protein ACHAPJ_009781 [Fusarium lateritium]
MSPTISARNTRSRRLRVTTGCLTCRERHVKCDEKKPQCVNCGKKNRTCKWEDSRGSKRSSISLDTSHSRSVLPSEDSFAAAPEPEGVDENLTDFGQIHDPDPAVHHDATVVSPFSATLGSILLDADYTHYDAGLEENTVGPIQPPTTVVFPLHTDNQIRLTAAEVGVFRNYVDNVSLWVS